MNRLQAKENLILIGIAEPTDEQITNYLNQMQGETKKYSDKADKYKDDAEKVKELQAKLDEIEKQNMSEIELANKEKELANDKVSELEAKIKAMELKTSLAEKGIVGEQADKLIESLGSGSLDVELLGQIITEREQASATAKEQEIANNSGNPGGGKGKQEDDDKPADVVNAEKMGALFGNKAESDTNRDFYVMK